MYVLVPPSGGAVDPAVSFGAHARLCEPRLNKWGPLLTVGRQRGSASRGY